MFPRKIIVTLKFLNWRGLICFLPIAFLACRENKETKDNQALKESILSGQQLAAVHCGRCHSLVDPSELPQSSWKNDVLPSMGHRLGIFKGDHQPDSLFDRGVGGAVVRRANIYPEQKLIAQGDWDKIVSYYLANAPDTIFPPERNKAIKVGLKNFRFLEAAYSHRPAMTSLVKILPDNRGIVYSDGKRNKSVLTYLTRDLQKKYDIAVATTPVHYYERRDTLLLTMAGNGVFPNDIPAGSLQKLSKSENSKTFDRAKVILSKLQRPVYMAYGDLDNDGDEDIVACEYGDLTGKLVWFQNMGHDRYSEKSLRGMPGAISAVIKDVDNDGFNDIIVLMAQGDEGVFLYVNKKNGFFTEKRLLSFSPLNGSQYIELADFNKDGFDDLIYVSGDNADLTPILKQRHGIYIFLNDGKLNFKQALFYQMNGAYKAMARDYDLDGDLDIAAISFFPDYLRYPEESFVYLQNKGNLKFDDYSFPQASKGRWIVMDAGDMDADGDIDLALGSFVYFTAQGDTTGLGKKWLTTGPSVIVLENTTRRK